jgi:hypothetical protein
MRFIGAVKVTEVVVSVAVECDTDKVVLWTILTAAPFTVTTLPAMTSAFSDALAMVVVLVRDLVSHMADTPTDRSATLISLRDP